nr:hypothetical protein [Tanacetum cinerariifolium]
MPLKRDLRLIDEHFKSESVDVSTISSSDDKTVKTVDITHKGVLCIEEPKSVMKNNFVPLIIEDWHSDDDIKDELSPTIEVKTIKPRDNLGKFEGKANEGYIVGYLVGNQSNGIAGTKEKLVACQDAKKKELEQEYILIPIFTTSPLIFQDAKNSEEDAGKKAPEDDIGEASDNGGHDNQVSRSEDGSLFQQDRLTEHNKNTNDINTVSSPVSTAGPSFVNAASQIPLNAAEPSASTNAFEEHSFE